MKENLELVEKLVEKTGLSYTEAKRALEKADWDILDALINLEAEGKTVGSAKYSTRNEGTRQQQTESEKSAGDEKKSTAGEDFKKNTIGVFQWLGKVFEKGNSNSIEMYRNGNRVIGMPVTVFVLLLIFGFWILIPAMVVGLFFGCRYRFSGPDLAKENVNAAMDKATDIADSIKQEFKNKENNGNNGSN